VLHPPLITTSEIAVLAGVELSTVTSWRSRYRDAFPQPVEVPDQDRRTTFYRRDKVVEFLRAHQLGRQHAADGAIRAGRPRTSGGAGEATRRPLRRSPAMAAPSWTLADVTMRFDLVATIGLADETERSEAACLEVVAAAARDLERILRGVESPSSTPEPSLNAASARLAATIQDLATTIARRDPSLEPLLWSESRYAEAGLLTNRLAGDWRSLHWLSGVSRNPQTAISIFDEIASRFRRSASPWTRRPLDTPNAITKLLPALTPTPPRTLLDLTCGIGSVGITAYRSGIRVHGFDRNANDVRIANQWRMLLERDAAMLGSAATFAVRDRLTGITAAPADLVVMSEPSMDTELLGKTAEVEYWQGIEMRLAFARKHTRPGGRTLFALPMHMLDPHTESDLASDSIAVALSVRRGWAGSLEAVFEIPTSQLALTTAILIFTGTGEQATGPILFASLPAHHRDEREVRDLLQWLREDRGDPGRTVRSQLARTAVAIDREQVASSNGNLTPSNWWRMAFVQQPERVEDVLRDDQDFIVTSHRLVTAAFASVDRLDITAISPPETPATWRPLSELLAADLIELIQPARPTTSSSDARGSQPASFSAGPSIARDGRAPIITPDRPTSSSPFNEATVALPRQARDGMLSPGDVIYWHGQEHPIYVRVISSHERAVLTPPGRGVRITPSGHRHGLTPNLLAFAIETSGMSVERAASRRAFESIRFPMQSATQDISEAIGWATDHFGDTAAAIAHLRTLEAEANDLARRAAEMRRDTAAFGSAEALSIRTRRRPVG